MFNDIVTGVSAAVVAILAALGLNTWKVQLKGTAEYELARRLLRAVLRTRDRVALTRSRFMSAEEMDRAFRAAGETRPVDAEEALRRRYELAIDARWRLLVTAASELEAEILEAEVLWGAPYVDAGTELRKLVWRLGNAIEEHLYDQRSKPPRGEVMSKEREERAVVLWRGAASGETDAFTGELTAVVSRFETLLRPKLQRVR